eukprot:COSAG06_NODE_40522_length_401_cov_0.850993_1_plen_98_part_10
MRMMRTLLTRVRHVDFMRISVSCDSNSLCLTYLYTYQKALVWTGAFGDVIVSRHPTPADTWQSCDRPNGGDDSAEGNEDEDEDDQNDDEPRGIGTESS